MSRLGFGIAAVMISLVGAGCRDGADSPGPGVNKVRESSSAVPADGRTYFGVQLAWKVDTPAAYADRLGRTPTIYGEYVPFPLGTGDAGISLDEQVRLVKTVGAHLMLTLMPNGGLDTVTDAAIDALVAKLARYNADGVRVFVRFGHEMNGSWYAWGQQPEAYVGAFRRVAAAVQQRASGSAMLWGPNYGGGYPFPGGAYSARQGTRSFEVLDTNGDGQLTMDDDPYGPYYPGDAYVDWVGITNHHWGHSWPWRENELPERHQFADQLTGTFIGYLGDERGLPDFYQVYAVEHAKPLAISETSAFFNPRLSGTGPTNLEIKRAWWSQFFAADVPTRFPKLKMVVWFEHYKRELEADVDVDWRATFDPEILGEFRSTLPSNLIFADDARVDGG